MPSALSVPTSAPENSPHAATRTHRNRWRDQIWASPLRPLTRLVALCFADHASDVGPVFVTVARGVERTGLSERAWKAAVAELRTLGWLTVHTPGRAGRDGGRAARYWLTLPADIHRDNDDPLAALNEGTSCTHSPGMRAPRAPEPLPTTNPYPPVAEPVDEPAAAARPGRPGEEGKRENTRDDVAALAETLAEPVEAVREALDACEQDPSIRNPRAALLGRVPAAREHLTAAVGRHAARGAAATRNRIQAEEADPALVCDHGTPRGRALTVDGAQVCPMCRNRSRRAA